MDPQLKSFLTSAILALATAGTTWGVAHGVVPAADQNVIANDLVTAAFAIGGGLIAWWKSRELSPKSMIQAVNAADNGVKVVPATMATADIPAVNEPQKGPTK